MPPRGLIFGGAAIVEPSLTDRDDDDAIEVGVAAGHAAVDIVLPAPVPMLIDTRPHEGAAERQTEWGGAREGGQSWGGRDQPLGSVLGLRVVPGPDLGPFFRGTALDTKMARKGGGGSGRGGGGGGGEGSRVFAIAEGLRRMGEGGGARTAAEATAVEGMAARVSDGTATQEVPGVRVYGAGRLKYGSGGVCTGVVWVALACTVVTDISSDAGGSCPFDRPILFCHWVR